MAEITKEYLLDALTVNSVSVLVKQFIRLDGESEKQQIGKPVRISYVNSVNGRKEVLAELPENFARGVLEVWGRYADSSGPSPTPNGKEVANE